MTDTIDIARSIIRRCLIAASSPLETITADETDGLDHVLVTTHGTFQRASAVLAAVTSELTAAGYRIQPTLSGYGVGGVQRYTLSVRLLRAHARAVPTLSGDRIVNLTPHAITIAAASPPVGSPVGSESARWSILPSGEIARACEEVIADDPIAGIPTVRVRYRGTAGLPDPTPGTWYVVSVIAAQAAAESGREILTIC